MPTNLLFHTYHLYPADVRYLGDFVGVSIWSAVEPVAGIFGAVSTTVKPSFCVNDQSWEPEFSPYLWLKHC